MKKFLKQLINLLCISFFLILALSPLQTLADACSDAHSGWSCQDPSARSGLSTTPCDTSITCSTSGNICCPSVATQTAAKTAYTSGQTKETAGDKAGACTDYQTAEGLLPSSITEAAIARVCAAGSTSSTSTTSESATPTIPLQNPLGGTAENPGGISSVPQLIGNIIKTILTVVGALALGMFVYGGFTWLISGGSPERIKKGKDILIWAVIGLVVIFASYTAVDFILTAFGV